MSLTYGIEDEGEELSLDTVELNKVILAMKPLVKAAQVLVLREIALYIKRQKKKQTVSPAGKVKRIGRKIIGRLSDIRLLKKMGTIRLCKLLLANVMTQNELKKGGENLSRQDRIVVRLAVCPQIVKFISKFRSEHADWPTLVHYLLYKNTSGKWKTREQKKRTSKHKKGDLPFPVLSDLPETNADDEDNDLESSTVKKFTAFKEAHDRALLIAQKKLLAEEAAENLPVVTHFKHPASPVEDDDDSDTSQLADDIVARLTGGRTQKDVKSDDEPEAYDDEPSNFHIKEPTEKVQITSDKPKIKNKLAQEESKKANMKTKEKKPLAKTPISQPDVVEEILVNEDPLLGFPEAEDENILGEDDAEMKKELKANKAKPGDSAVLKRYIQQKKRSNFSRNIGGRGRGSCAGDTSRPMNHEGIRRGSFVGRGGGTRGSRLRNPTVSFDTTGLHPSWAAKREQKTQVISLNSSASSKRIVFD